MNLAVEIQEIKGEFFARRMDGKPLTADDKADAKVIIQSIKNGYQHRAKWILQSDDRKGLLFLPASDRRKKSTAPVFDEDEMRAILVKKSDATIRLIATVKRAFKGARVIR
jgi:hypothetical protein